MNKEDFMCKEVLLPDKWLSGWCCDEKELDVWRLSPYLEEAGGSTSAPYLKSLKSIIHAKRQEKIYLHIQNSSNCLM